jgi:hypothetical protein
MLALRCPGLSCELLSPLALERDGVAIAAGFCLCRDSLVRADRRQRLRSLGKLRDHGSSAPHQGRALGGMVLPAR